MKRKLIFAGLIVATIIALQSCDRTLKVEERRKQELFTKLINTKDVYVQGQVVPNVLATACIENYRQIYKESPESVEIQRAYTDNVMFGNKAMLKWMFDMADSTNVDNIRIFFGVYSDIMAKNNPESNIKPGRLTVFLWPYHGDVKATYKKFGGGGVGGPQKDTVGSYDMGTLTP